MQTSNRQGTVDGRLAQVAEMEAGAGNAPPAGRKPVLAVVAGCTLLLWAVLDVVGRLGPIHWLSVQPAIEASRFHARWGAFRPNTTIESEWTGESAVTGNLRPAERRSTVRFSTDDLGFRATPGLDRNGNIDLVFFDGESFAYGASLSDEETLPAALTRRGLHAYNAGHPWWIYMKLDALDRLAGKLGGGRKSVVAVYWENAEYGIGDAGFDAPGDTALNPGIEEAIGSLRFARNSVTAAMRISPLEVLTIRAFKSLSNDTLLPNRYKSSVEAHALPNGERMLFMMLEIRRVTEPPGDDVVARNAKYFGQLAQHLAARNLDLYVILLPNRYSVYGPLVDRTRPAKPSDYLEHLETELNRRNVATFNATQLMRAHASEDVASGHLAYFREDHHWTPLGVERVADAFRDFVASRQNQNSGLAAHAF